MCHTLPSTNPWLSVKVPMTTEVVNSTIEQVVIYNRADCCQDQLNTFQLWVGASVGDYQSPTSTECGVFAFIVLPL